jgi:PKHD-type hydroxylase
LQSSYGGRGLRAACAESPAAFVDGRVSNPANQTKVNLQADPTDPQYAVSVQMVSAAFARSREFLDFALPKHVAPPMLCRYEPGMKYGAHADAAVI